MPRLPLILLHGYSDRSASFATWRDRLLRLGYRATDVHVGDYVSLSNELTVKDIAEGLDRALRIEAGLDTDQPFDAIVHSTGMLVVRAWLTTYARRRHRLKHLIGLAPATFGSPMAHKGRSWLGGVFKGGKEPGPDFMEAGDRVLAALELASVYTWQLAHRDLVADEPIYGPSSATPYPFIFIGLDDYGWLKRTITEPGTDGTVRWAGAGFNCRKLSIDLTRDPAAEPARRIVVHDWRNADVPLIFLDGVNHNTILRKPPDALVAMVQEALAVTSPAEYRAWRAKHDAISAANLARARARPWQQFVVHAIDERGDPISDYFVELCHRQAGGALKPLEDFDMDVHAFGDDPSFRCFHVDLDTLGPETRSNLYLRIIASSGTELVGYHGFGSEKINPAGTRVLKRGKWDAALDLTRGLRASGAPFFVPYTTTLIEFMMNREPMPLVGVNRVTRFV